MAGPVADPVDRHGGQGSKAVGKRGHNRGPGRCGQLGLDRRLGQRYSPQQFGRRRGGHAELAVRDPNAARAGRNRRHDQPLHAEQVPADGRADDVGNRVGRPDFVEMHLLDGRAVDLRLGLGQPGEDSPGDVLRTRRESAGVDQAQNVVQVAMDVFRLVLDRDLGGPKSVFLDFLGHEPAAGQAERRDSIVQPIEGDAGVDQGPEGHVAADSAGAIEVGNSHGGSLMGGGASILASFATESETTSRLDSGPRVR